MKLRRFLAALGLADLPWWDHDEEEKPREQPRRPTMPALPTVSTAPAVPMVQGEPLRAILAARDFGHAKA